MRILRVPDTELSKAPPEESKNPYGEVQESEIILGGCYRELKFRSGTGDAAKVVVERTMIAQIPFNKMDSLAASWGKPPLEAMLYIGAEGAKIETLLGDSFATVIQEGRRLNFTLLRNWLKWQSEAMSATGREDQISQIIEKILTQKAESENLPLEKSSNS